MALPRNFQKNNLVTRENRPRVSSGSKGSPSCRSPGKMAKTGTALRQRGLRPKQKRGRHSALRVFVLSKIPLWFETSPFRGKRVVDKTAEPIKSFFVTPPFREGQSARPLSVGCGVSRRTGRLWIETYRTSVQRYAAHARHAIRTKSRKRKAQCLPLPVFPVHGPLSAPRRPATGTGGPT